MHAQVSFLLIIYCLNLLNYLLRARLCFTNFLEQSGLNEQNVFVDSLNIYSVYNVMNKLYIHIFQWFRNIFHVYIHHPVYCFFIHVLFSLTKSTIVNHQLSIASDRPVRLAEKAIQRRKNQAEIETKNYLKKLQLFYIGDN